jgi:hypothetical protein
MGQELERGWGFEKEKWWEGKLGVEKEHLKVLQTGQVLEELRELKLALGTAKSLATTTAEVTAKLKETELGFEWVLLLGGELGVVLGFVWEMVLATALAIQLGRLWATVWGQKLETLWEKKLGVVLASGMAGWWEREMEQQLVRVRGKEWGQQLVCQLGLPWEEMLGCELACLLEQMKVQV